MKKLASVMLLLVVCCVAADGCHADVQSASGTKMATTGTLPTDTAGHTIEQKNIIQKIQTENNPDKSWFLYVISPFDRQIIIKSSLKGKITSSGKRLTPKKLAVNDGLAGTMTFKVGEQNYYTDEMPAEDGTFGDSTEYIYWTDLQGRNHRHYMIGGQIIHVVDEEMSLVELIGGTK